MKIVPNRTMRLGGRRVEFNKAIDVSEDDARIALRHGWAVEAPAKQRASAAKAEAEQAAEPDATDAAGE